MRNSGGNGVRVDDSILQQFDAQHRPFLADLSHYRKPRDRVPGLPFRVKDLRDLDRTFVQHAVFVDQPQRGQRRRAGQRISRVGVPVIKRPPGPRLAEKRVVDFVRGQRCRERQITAGQTLSTGSAGRAKPAPVRRRTAYRSGRSRRRFHRRSAKSPIAASAHEWPAGSPADGPECPPPPAPAVRSRTRRSAPHVSTRSPRFAPGNPPAISPGVAGVGTRSVGNMQPAEERMKPVDAAEAHRPDRVAVIRAAQVRRTVRAVRAAASAGDIGTPSSAQLRRRRRRNRRRKLSSIRPARGAPIPRPVQSTAHSTVRAAWCARRGPTGRLNRMVDVRHAMSVDVAPQRRMAVEIATAVGVDQKKAVRRRR